MPDWSDIAACASTPCTQMAGVIVINQCVGEVANWSRAYRVYLCKIVFIPANKSS